MKWIYISPHFDDAVLSCGGLVAFQAASGLNVEIWTVTSGVPSITEGSVLMRQVQDQWGIDSPAEAVLARQIEENRAVKRVGASGFGFGLLDCIYRADERGNFLYQGIFDQIHPDEVMLPHQIADRINHKLGHNDIVVFPLAIGSHIDHRLVHLAAKFVEAKKLYYIDIPYFFKEDRNLSSLRESGIEKNIAFPINFVTDWVDGIWEYRSQISSLFESRSDLEAKISSYYGQFNGTSLWEVPENTMQGEIC